MPDAVLYQEKNGDCPILRFFDRESDRSRAIARARIGLLEQRGNDLRRPHADYLEREIYELRWKFDGKQYRILYFFHGRRIVVLSHAFIKRGSKVPPSEIDRAVRRKRLFDSDPDTHTHQGENGV